MSVRPADFCQKWRMKRPYRKAINLIIMDLINRGLPTVFVVPCEAICKRKWVDGCKTINPFIPFMLFGKTRFINRKLFQ
jgi:hypothetical protein